MGPTEGAAFDARASRMSSTGLGPAMCSTRSAPGEATRRSEQLEPGLAICRPQQGLSERVALS